MNNTELLSINLSDNLANLKVKLKDCYDITQKNILLKGKKHGCFIYANGLVDIDLLQRDFIRPVLSIDYEDLTNENVIDYLPLFNISRCYDFTSLLNRLSRGETILLIDGANYAISCNLRKFEKRPLDEPEAEKNVKGPHDGFIESIDVNIAILRRKIQDTNLKFKTLKLGDITKSIVAIAYIEGISNPTLLDTLYNKLIKINTDGLLEIGLIEQFITDSPHSPFPQYQSSERPNKAAAALLEGRFVIMLDGTPVVLIAPISFFTLFRALDDYSNHWIYGTLIALLRFTSMIVAIILPSLYIALTTFHYYMVPLKLLITLAESRSRVPFPPILEAFIMELTIEMITEASIRLPTYIGTTIGVIGGIIIGQSAVNAGVVSSLLIIVVAVTAIASYTVPSYNLGLVIRILRFAYLILTSIFGIVGIIVCNVFLFAHLISLESLGQPYFQPIIPFKRKDIKDTIVRLPVKYLKTRPDIAKPFDNERGKKNEQQK